MNGHIHIRMLKHAFPKPSINQDILRELYMGDSPYNYSRPEKADHGYPHTNIRGDIVDIALDISRCRFWLEIGSMLGGSAIVVANRIEAKKVDCGVVCLDPFTGDVNMWSWERDSAEKGSWRFLGIREGSPTIYQRFLANVAEAGKQHAIVPIQCTSMVGLALIGRLKRDGRIGSTPDVIYVDSAHEIDETRLEVSRSWDLLKEGGILMGDDWGWDAVRHDVLSVFGGSDTSGKTTREFMDAKKPDATHGSVLLYGGQWVVCK